MAQARAIDPEIGRGAWGSLAGALPEGATEREWLLDGEATRYRLIGGYGPDGRWRVEQAETAPFRTRFLAVCPPADQFNGVVVVTWNNVSAGFDAMSAGPSTATMLQDGYAVIGVSAQYLGVHGERGLVSSDPARYGTLRHPGDDYSYDVFTQAVRIVSGRRGGEGDVLGGLRVRHVVASGASQSASRLATVYNALHPAGLIDAYHLPVYFGNGTVLDSTSREVTPSRSMNWSMRMLPAGLHVLRQDLGVPVFILNSESEAQVFTTNQQPDSEHLVIWENAGASHIGSTAGDDRFGLPDARCRGSFAPSQRAVWQHLRGWLEDAVTPPSQWRLEKAPDGWLARDEGGNAVAGIRWPHVVVPLGTHRAEPPSEGHPDLMGSTTAFEPAKVRALYGTFEQYEKRFADAVDALVARGVVLPEDAGAVTDPLAASAWGSGNRRGIEGPRNQ